MVDIDGKKALITTIFTHKMRSSEEIFVSVIPMLQRRLDEELEMPILSPQHGGFEIFSARKIAERPLYYVAVRKGLGRKLERVNMGFPNEERDMGVRRDHEFLLIPAELEII